MSCIFYWYVIRVSYIIVISNEPHILLIYYKSELYSVISNEPHFIDILPSASYKKTTKSQNRTSRISSQWYMSNHSVALCHTTSKQSSNNAIQHMESLRFVFLYLFHMKVWYLRCSNSRFYLYTARFCDSHWDIQLPKYLWSNPENVTGSHDSIKMRPCNNNNVKHITPMRIDYETPCVYLIRVSVDSHHILCWACDYLSMVGLNLT